MFFLDDPETIRHGYYLINDNIKTLSKFEAFQLSGKDWSKIKFIFNDDVFEKYDWTVEPTDDIYELYRQRAQQLREKYDYLVLMYSGGIDSHTVLETFLQNNIKLDEICSFSTSDVVSKTDKLNQEIFNSALPFVNTLDKTKTSIVFRNVEIGKLIIDSWNDEFHCENFQYYTSNAQWVTVARSNKLKFSIKEHMALTEKGKTICYIWGAEKPSLTIQENKYALRVVDAAVDFGTREYINRTINKDKFSNFYDEAFYICRDFPKISIKQAHLLVKLINTIPNTDNRVCDSTELPSTGPYVTHHIVDNNIKYLTKKTVDGCIYPNAILNRFGDDKLYNSSLILTPKDDWFALSNHPNRWRFENQLRKVISENMNYFKYNYSDDYRFFKNEKHKNIIPVKAVPIASQLYFIKEVQHNE